jgi:hypothetical protein
MDALTKDDGDHIHRGQREAEAHHDGNESHPQAREFDRTA